MAATPPRLAHLFIVVALLALAAMACNLSSTPPTPTSAPFPTTEPIPLFPTSDPALGNPAFALTPTIDFAGGTTGGGGAVVGSDPNCIAPQGWITYTVETGDSLGLLAMQTDSTVNELATSNCMTDPDSLYVGQVIYLPRVPVVTQ